MNISTYIIQRVGCLYGIYRKTILRGNNYMNGSSHVYNLKANIQHIISLCKRPQRKKPQNNDNNLKGNMLSQCVHNIQM